MQGLPSTALFRPLGNDRIFFDIRRSVAVHTHRNDLVLTEWQSCRYNLHVPYMLHGIDAHNALTG
jgi:hypothetical protein